jgi:hypothetical protein
MDAKSLYLQLRSGIPLAPDDVIEEEEKKSDSYLNDQERVESIDDH